MLPPAIGIGEIIRIKPSLNHTQSGKRARVTVVIAFGVGTELLDEEPDTSRDTFWFRFDEFERESN